MSYTRGAPYHPQTQGRIECYHRSMKNVIKLESYYLPWERDKVIAQWVDYYNNRLHESLDNITPADMYHGRKERPLTQRQIIKSKNASTKEAN